MDAPKDDESVTAQVKEENADESEIISEEPVQTQRHPVVHGVRPQVQPSFCGV